LPSACLERKGIKMAKENLLKGRVACDKCSYVICVCKPVTGYFPQSENCVEDKSSTLIFPNKTDDDRIICAICQKKSNEHTKADNDFCDNELKLCQEQMLSDGMALSFNITIINGKRVKTPRLMSTERMKRIKEDLDES